MLQDSLPSDEPVSTSANMGLVKWMSEATESEANRPEPQESVDLHESLSHASSDTVVEVVSKKTESEAATSLGSRIPPELFDDILFYVNVDRVSQQEDEELGSLIRDPGMPSTQDILTDLRRCSLVCLFWANRCREHMFSDATLWIRSYEDAKIFRRYVISLRTTAEYWPRKTPRDKLLSFIFSIFPPSKKSSNCF
ncbi:hypothetical protein BC629DRAFT_968707 [Irpex lacteus]|nr:hypothetical protein BC629DRAFT_968707 [Irpex lacteus]